MFWTVKIKKNFNVKIVKTIQRYTRQLYNGQVQFIIQPPKPGEKNFKLG